jgi:hypothetical protein
MVEHGKYRNVKPTVEQDLQFQGDQQDKLEKSQRYLHQIKQGSWGGFEQNQNKQENRKIRN